MPAMDADMKLAIVPASMELKLAKPHSAKVVKGDRARAQAPGANHLAELPEGDELVRHHAQAEEVPDRRGFAPGHPQQPRHRAEDPAENLLEARREVGEPEPSKRVVRAAEHPVDESNQRQ